MCEISQNPSTRDYSWFCLQLVCTKHRFDLISFDFHEAYKYSHERFHELFCDANFRAPANATFSAGSSSKLELTVLKNEFERVRIQILIRAVELTHSRFNETTSWIRAKRGVSLFPRL